MKSQSRAEAKRFADEHGYFWLPCPRCGKWFGGHEWGREHVRCERDADGTLFHGTCCVGPEIDPDACRRAHERDGA